MNIRSLPLGGFWCNSSWIFQDVPHQIWEAQTSDGHTFPFIVRFFHNKVFFYLNNFLRCYFYPWSTDAVSTAFTAVGVFLLYFSIYKVVTLRKKKLFLIFTLSSLVPLFNLLGQEYSAIFFLCVQAFGIVLGLVYIVVDVKRFIYGKPARLKGN
jgi:hypothetical protein